MSSDDGDVVECFVADKIRKNWRLGAKLSHLDKLTNDVALVKQIEFFEINNPCIGVCQNGPRGFCKGCFRSREERQHWSVLEQDVKRHIIKACGQRELRARLLKSEKPVAAGDASQSDLL